MTYLPKYKKEDFVKVSWEDYGKTLEKLYKKVSNYLRKNKIKIDAVVPILRGAALPGVYLAFKLKLLRILPIQYKYFFKNKKIELRRILDIPKGNLGLPKKPVFLLVENNHCFGLTAQAVAKDLKTRFPGCKIIYAAEHMDYSCQKIDYIDKGFYGRLTNETKKLTDKECRRKKIKNVCYLFPWEDLEEEWSMVTAKQFKYKDLEKILKASRRKFVIDNE